MFQDIWGSVILLKRFYSQIMEPVCERYGITRMELDILLFLANTPEYDTATDLVNRRCPTKSHVSSSITSLERNGYLERVYQKDNRKTAHLKPLPKADPVIQDGRGAQKVLTDMILKGFTEKEKERMEANFAKITANIRDALSGGIEDAL